MRPDFQKTYEPKEHEERIYKLWESSGAFAPEAQRYAGHSADARRNIGGQPRGNLRRSAFSMVLPPPNATGVLHIGHALGLTIEDVMARYHRMKGEKTLWIPGADHAAIATQEKVERELYKKEGKTRHEVGREAFLRRVDAFVAENRSAIVHQLKRMGASLDWSREAFTLDEPRSRAVREAFVRMYKAGLIYRGARIVNWDPKLQTTVSDDEVEWREERAPFYFLQYGPFTIATARPETKFGDKYVVMHPADKRYYKWKHGAKLEVEWINGKITATVIKDKAVDPKFGTGAMTITPAHDAADFEIAERHKLEREQIVDFRGRLLPIAGEFGGKKIQEARPLIVAKLKAKGLLAKIDEQYTHRIAANSRGGGMIEPQVMEQWFVAVNKKFEIGPSRLKGIRSGQNTTLKEIMMRAVKSGQIKIIPKRFEKVYFHWIQNLRDWCISRQIWYGHRIPVYYCKQGRHEARNAASELCENPMVSVNAIQKCPHCNGEMEQDPDTLDTWFSSGLWTFSTLGWPEDTRDLNEFHPTAVLETGYDILFFWVARMVLMSGFLLGDIPFKTVYLHGLVRDKDRQKMSKSKGNVIDPLGVAELYGTDAVRMALVAGNAPGNDPIISEDKIRGYRNFATKIWNIARFLLLERERGRTLMKREEAQAGEKRNIRFTPEDRKRMREYEGVKKKAAKHLEAFEFHRAAEVAYHYLWHTFADRIIEETKPRLKDGSESDRSAAYALVTEIFLGCLKLLHPFMPFVTEAVYQELYAQKSDRGLLMAEEW
jgi:valyl-tRNA synthetase